jgi:hypothetical protein
VSENDSAPLRPVPPAPGWYRIPDNPNYEHFWDGQKWTSQRYWGGASTSAPLGSPPPAVDWTQPEVLAPQDGDPTGNIGLSGRTSFGSPDTGGHQPQTRYYAVATIIAPPVFVIFFTWIAISAIPTHSGRPIGIGAAVLAVLFVLIFSRRPYVAIVLPDGSLTFKALIGSKQTAISRVTRIGLRTGARGAASWIFEFDGTRALLGDIGGKALARYVIECNPAVEYPVSHFFR